MVGGGGLKSSKLSRESLTPFPGLTSTYDIWGLGDQQRPPGFEKHMTWNLLCMGAGRQRAIRPSAVNKEKCVLFTGMEGRQGP